MSRLMFLFLLSSFDVVNVQSSTTQKSVAHINTDLNKEECALECEEELEFEGFW